MVIVNHMAFKKVKDKIESNSKKITLEKYSCYLLRHYSFMEFNMEQDNRLKPKVILESSQESMTLSN